LCGEIFGTRKLVLLVLDRERKKNLAFRTKAMRESYEEAAKQGDLTANQYVGLVALLISVFISVTLVIVHKS
jgi:hypothetical protein